MVQNNRFETEGTPTAVIGTEPALPNTLAHASPDPGSEPGKFPPPLTALDPARTVAEAEQWLTVIPPTAACYRLLQLGILRRDVALLEGLLSVLRST
jgi:hypothetical protein